MPGRASALLAEGSRAAAQIVGQGSAAFAPHVKGLELPATSRGRCRRWRRPRGQRPRCRPQPVGAYEADLSGRHDRLVGGSAHVAAAVATEDRAAVMDSLILCKFLRGVFEDPFPEWARLRHRHRLGRRRRRAGGDRAPDRARQAGVQRPRGWTRADDTLPDRFLEEPLEMASGRRASLTRDRPMP